MGKEVGEEEGKGNGKGCSPEGQHVCASAFWVLWLEFFSLLQAGMLGEVSGEGFSRIFIRSPDAHFQGPGLH